MKQNKLHLIFTLLVAVLLASCSKSVPDYAKLIPEDAGMVIRIDIKQISKKSGFGDNDKLKAKIEKALKQQLDGKIKDKFMAILDNPAEAGLDLRDPVFIYINTEADEVGMVGAVYKAEKFEDLINVIANEGGLEKVKKTGDQYYTFYNDVLLTFTDDWFYFGPIRDDDAQKTAKAVAKSYESGKKSIVDNEGFQQMCEKEGILQLFILGNWLYEHSEAIGMGHECPEYCEPLDEDDEPMTCYIDPFNYFNDVKEMFEIDINDLAAILDTKIDKGEASMSVELAAVNDKGKKQMDDIDKMLGGKDEGFFFRFNFGFIDKMAKNLDGYRAKQAEMVAKLLNYVELKYEGDCRLTLHLVTNEDDKTPVQSIIDIAQKEFGI